ALHWLRGRADRRRRRGAPGPRPPRRRGVRLGRAAPHGPRAPREGGLDRRRPLRRARDPRGQLRPRGPLARAPRRRALPHVPDPRVPRRAALVARAVGSSEVSTDRRRGMPNPNGYRKGPVLLRGQQVPATTSDQRLLRDEGGTEWLHADPWRVM